MRFYTIFILLVFLGISLAAQQPLLTVIDSLPEQVKVINCMEAEGDSVLWLGTNAGLVKITKSDIQLFTKKSDPSLFKINTIFVDEKGTKWLGTYRSSIIRFKDTTDYTEHSFIQHTAGQMQLVSSLMMNTPANGSSPPTLWIGTTNGILLSFSPVYYKFTVYNTPTSNNINGIFIDSLAKTWISTPMGMYYYAKKGWKSIPELSNAGGVFRNGNDIWAIGKDAQFNTTILYYESVEYFIMMFRVGRKFQWMPTDFIGAGNDVLNLSDMGFGKGDLIWIASDDGLVKYIPVTGDSQRLDNIFPELKTKIEHIVVVNQSLIWASSPGRTLYKIEFR